MFYVDVRIFLHRLADSKFLRSIFNVDVRSIRYPGIISYKSLPGGGTTDYAVDIFHEAIKHQRYSCFIEKDVYLPMMYMDDAIRALIAEGVVEDFEANIMRRLNGLLHVSDRESGEAKKRVMNLAS